MEARPTVETVAGRIRGLVEPARDVLAVYLHGSALTETFRAESDLDLALLLQPGRAISAMDRLRMAAEWSRTLGRTADIGILSFDNLVYFAQVIAKGQCLFCRDEATANRLIGQALSLYAALREERRAIEAAYAA